VVLEVASQVKEFRQHPHLDGDHQEPAAKGHRTAAGFDR
jgi:hypothetical protein